jgi:hypothetical protein
MGMGKAARVVPRLPLASVARASATPLARRRPQGVGTRTLETSAMAVILPLALHHPAPQHLGHQSPIPAHLLLNLPIPVPQCPRLGLGPPAPRHRWGTLRQVDTHHRGLAARHRGARVSPHLVVGQPSHHPGVTLGEEEEEASGTQANHCRTRAPPDLTRSSGRTPRQRTRALHCTRWTAQRRRPAQSTWVTSPIPSLRSNSWIGSRA